jgi:hypothetical protein
MRCAHCGQLTHVTMRGTRSANCERCHSYARCACGGIYWCSCSGAPYGGFASHSLVCRLAAERRQRTLFT